MARCRHPKFRAAVRWGVWVCTVGMIAMMFTSVRYQPGYTSVTQITDSAPSNVFIASLEQGRFSMGWYPISIVFREDFMRFSCTNGWYRDGDQPDEVFITHSMLGDWYSPPRLSRFTLGQSTLIHFEFPLIYPTMIFIVASLYYLYAAWVRFRHRLDGCCKKCGYLLEGLASGVCPECGEAYEA